MHYFLQCGRYFQVDNKTVLRNYFLLSASEIREILNCVYKESLAKNEKINFILYVMCGCDFLSVCERTVGKSYILYIRAKSKI